MYAPIPTPTTPKRVNLAILLIYVFLTLFGLGKEVGLNVNTLIKARYFGRKAFGSIRGTTMMFATPVGIAAPIYVGWAYDTTGSYITAFTLVAVLLASSAVLMSFILPPKPPARVTDVHEIV